MVIPLEIIEQIMDEPRGRSVEWLCKFVEGFGRQDAFAILRGMWSDGYVGFTEPGGDPLPDWTCLELLRDEPCESSVRVVATDAGLRWAFGAPS